MNPDLTRKILVLDDDADACVAAARRRAGQTEQLADIGEAAAVLAHEGRNVLQQTMCNLHILALNLTNRPELLDVIGRARNAQNDLARLFEDFHSYAASLTLHREVLNLSVVWREAWSNLDDLCREKAGDLQERIQTDGLSADRFRLKQVFRNLFENALVACSAPARIDVACTPVTLPDGRPGIRVAVHDNGPGLSEEQRQRAFEPFYTTKPNGTGLGLAITKRIVAAHGGHIAVGIGSASGAEFEIILPYEEARSALETVSAAAGDLRRSVRHRLRQKERSKNQQEETAAGAGWSGAVGGSWIAEVKEEMMSILTRWEPFHALRHEMRQMRRLQRTMDRFYGRNCSSGSSAVRAADFEFCPTVR